jgi:hypothetical protein
MTIAIQQPLFSNMETSSGSARFSGCRSTHGWWYCLALAFGAAIFASGCGKGNSPGPAAGATPSPTQAVQDSSPPTASAARVNSQPVPAAPATNVASAPPDLRQLNQELIKWVVQNHQRPKSFEDFVARANVQVPPPPAGKRYVIDKRGFVALVDSSTR